MGPGGDRARPWTFFEARPGRVLEARPLRLILHGVTRSSDDWPEKGRDENPAPDVKGQGPDLADEHFTFNRQLYQVPDPQWGFSSYGRQQHPGLCMGVTVGGRDGVFLKGRSSDMRAKRSDEALVAPTAGNGLDKDTYFSLRPRVIPMRQVRLYHKNRWLGTMDAEVSKVIRERMFHLFDIEEGH